MKKKIFITIGLIILTTLAFSYIAQAYTIPPDLRPENEPFNIKDKSAADATIFVLQIIAGGLLYFAAPIAVIMIVMGGFKIVTGGAETESREQAKKHLTWSILGLLLIILSYSAVRYVIDFVIKAGELKAPTETPAPATTSLNKFDFGNITITLPDEGTKHHLS